MKKTQRAAQGTKYQDNIEETEAELEAGVQEDVAVLSASGVGGDR